jgi:hypothetical protein
VFLHLVAAYRDYQLTKHRYLRFAPLDAGHCSRRMLFLRLCDAYDASDYRVGICGCCQGELIEAFAQTISARTCHEQLNRNESRQECSRHFPRSYIGFGRRVCSIEDLL